MGVLDYVSFAKRFSELQRLLPQISRQVLILQLRELEQMGLLHRQVSRQRSSKVEYALTEVGWRSEPLFRQIYAWGRWTSKQMGLKFDWPVNDEPEARVC